MKVLWITNTVFPEASRSIGIPPPVTGGWMYGLAERIATNPDVALAVAAVRTGGVELERIRSVDTEYFLIPAHRSGGYPQSCERHWTEICRTWRPDVVHLHGTEYPTGLSCMRSQPELAYVVSLQGLTGVCVRYHLGGIEPWSFVRHLTLRDIARRDTVFQSRRRRIVNGEYERECIQRATIVVGRTSWDKLHAKTIDPDVDYRYCGESLRPAFYDSPKWRLGEVRRHSLFVSQGQTPLKGLHQLLRAIALLTPEFPGINVRIGGNNIVAADSFACSLKRTGYGSYIGGLIRKLGIGDRVHFTGLLGELEMINEYRRAHVYVCPSIIENSPNSLAEAQLLGVPVVASRAGGIPDMVDDGGTGLLYRFEEIEALADSIRRLFRDDNLALALGQRASEAAGVRHDRTDSVERTLSLYRELAAGCS